MYVGTWHWFITAILQANRGLRNCQWTSTMNLSSPFDPFLLKKSYQAMDDEVLTLRGQKVVIRPYILPHISKLTAEEIASLGGKEGIRRQQGFYIYRNKRLLAWGTWFRLMRQGDLSKLARVQVDLPNSLDDLWTLDIKKSTAIPPAELRQSLSAIIERIAEKSKQTWVYRGRKETSDTVCPYLESDESAKR